MNLAPVGLTKDKDKTGTIDFSRDIRPILAKHCFACHGPDKEEGGIKLVDFEHAISKGESGKQAVVPNHPESSALIHRVENEDENERMPPEGKPLSPREIELLKQWIAEGAEFKKHWAFQPVTRFPIPEARQSDWARTPIDRFLLASLEASDLRPNPEASKRELVRRLYINVLGLPPTPSEVEAFIQDSSEMAYEQLVDRLLADPRMGERWARHWLDLVRYAETNSFERDGPKPNAWKYRDYVIDSINRDKPYNRFLQEQLAGDELDHVTPETLTATGFYRLGIWDDEPADRELARFDEYDDIVSTAGQAFLGLTLNCARCHDHKIDPISQKDYYQMVALFRDVTSYGDRGNERTNSQIDMTPPSIDDLYVRVKREIESTETEMKEIEQKGIVKMPAEDQRATEGPERGRILREKLKDFLSVEEWNQWSSKKERVKQLQESIKSLPPRDTVLGLARCEAKPPETHILARGNPHAPGETVQPDFPKLFETPSPQWETRAEGAKSAGRRKVLAEWLGSSDHWLTSRVIVNRLWQHHFGRGIHKSPNNFGQMGEPPTHPELLDWLASELVRNDWNLKPIHRMILLSSAYRMSSQVADEPSRKALAKDPANNLFWRFNMRRLSAEEIRDSVLATSGQLNRTMHGPSIFPRLADEVKAGQSVPGKGWNDSRPSEANKRSVYIHIKRSLIPPELSNFDFPETDTSCEGRFLTTQPAQALGMLNGAFMQEQANALADRVRREERDFEKRCEKAIEFAWLRPASQDDILSAKRLRDRLQSEHRLNEDEVIVYFCLIVLNANEFMYVD